LPRRQIAITSASVTSSAVIPALIDQPTTRRENRSMTIALGRKNYLFDASRQGGKIEVHEREDKQHTQAFTMTATPRRTPARDGR